MNARMIYISKVLQAIEIRTDLQKMMQENNDARLILRNGTTPHDRVQTENQELQPWTAVSTLLGLVSRIFFAVLGFQP